MAETRASLRRFWLNVHLWLGIALAILIIPISISGALLVIHDDVEPLLNPARHSTSAVTLPLSSYLSNARVALGREVSPTAIRLPDEDGGPVVVQARGRGADGAPPRFLNVYLDPKDARVIEVVNFRESIFGFLHVFHENLTIPQYSGRAIVGWVGVAMLISSLSGIYLWWPRNGGFVRGLRWRRSGTSTNSNLHHILGFWISIPLAVVSATGIYLGFPQQGRDLLSTVAPVSPRPSFGQPARQTTLSVDDALKLAVDATPGASGAAVFLATAQQGQSPVWRVQVRKSDVNGMQTVLVDDTARTVTPVMPLSGDRVSQWIRWIHEGSHSGRVWQIIVFLTGVLPTLFVVTGTVMWLQRRRRQARLDSLRAKPSLSPAE